MKTVDTKPKAVLLDIEFFDCSVAAIKLREHIKKRLSLPDGRVHIVDVPVHVSISNETKTLSNMQLRRSIDNLQIHAINPV
jgi:hypothetical protein